MGGMIRYEWKKIWSSRLTQLSVLGCTLFLLFCTWAELRQISAWDSQGNQHSGTAAKEILKQTQLRQELDQESVEGIMEEYLEKAEEIAEAEENPEDALDKFWRTVWLSQGELYGLIKDTYEESVSDLPAENVFRQNMGRDFYQARMEKVREYTARLRSGGVISAKEAEYWNDRNATVSEYVYGYCKGWKSVLQGMKWSILIMMITCVGIAPVFAGEYQSKCDSLFLCMKYGRSRLPAAKIAAVWLFASVVYFGLTILNSVWILLSAGAEGWDTSVQFLYPTVPVSYPVTVGQACLLMLLLGYVLTLGIMAMTLWMSSIFKNAYGVIVVALLLLIVPSFLQAGFGGYLLQHILALLPSNIMSFDFTNYTAYAVGGKMISCLSMDLIVNGAAAVIFSAAGYGMFRKHQVNK